MGKDLNGKELGVGISQRKDGLYTARFTNSQGKRVQKYFQSPSDCQSWLYAVRSSDKTKATGISGNMPVSDWFEYWITEIKGDNIKPHTIKCYRERFIFNIKDDIGTMPLSEVKPMHCQSILNKMAAEYRNSTIRLTRITLFTFLQSAVDNELIIKNPVTRTVKCPDGKKPRPGRVLTVDEQRAFLKTAMGTSCFNQFAFILQTGLRTGEMIGLRWSDIDLENRIIHIRRTVEYVVPSAEWRAGSPKSKSGYRDIPLTKSAMEILDNQKNKLRKLESIPEEFSDYVFLGSKGTPIPNYTYDSAIYSLARASGVEKFSMHTLRHTFATRCIEAGMRPKTLQMILGHSNIGMTMNLYVHVTEDEKLKELESIEEMLRLI